MADTQVPARGKARAARMAEEKRWRRVFLETLASTSNVAASARAADVPAARAYEARRKDAGFHRAWQEALCEGYEHLEMEMLHRLREGEIKRAAGAKVGVRVYDNATSLRLLTAHRESVSRQQAIRGNREAREVIAEINERIARLRQPSPVLLDAPAQTDGEAEGESKGEGGDV
jgi:hypothetical protein